MKTVSKSIYIILLLCICYASEVNGQCGYGWNDSGITPVNPTAASQFTPSIKAGQYFLMNVVNGGDYTLSTCGLASWDTQISVYNESTAAFISYNDDFCGTSSETTFMATFTGQVRVIVTRFNCSAHNGRSTQVEYYGGISQPELLVNDVLVDEDAGTAIFTATHNGLDTSGSFSANYSIVAGSATQGTDYTTSSGLYTGTLNFNGTAGDTDQITVNITDDFDVEPNETYTIQFTSVTDTSVDITDTATGTIINDDAAAVIQVSNISVQEDAGTATFTVNHTGGSRPGAFTVDYLITAGTATEGIDYTTGSGLYTGTLNFNGTAGDTDQITVLITDDSFYESSETYTISFTLVTDSSVDITDTATGTINDNEVVLTEVPLTLFNEFNGYYDYSVTGGSLRDANNPTYCSIKTTSTVNGLTSVIPPTGVITKAFLLWSHSNQVPDTEVTFEGQAVNADFVYGASMSGGRLFYGMMSDVTSIIEGIVDPTTNVYDFTDLDVDNTNVFANYCSTGTVLGGWSLLVFYEEDTLPAVSINMYHGFKGESNTSQSYTLDGFYAIGSTDAKTTVLSWEGDSTLDGSSSGTTNPNGEALTVTDQGGTTTILSGDGGQTGNNAYNSTIFNNTPSGIINYNDSYGLDLDTFDISSYISAADSQITVDVHTGQDFVIANMVLVKVPSNLIVGNIFEDINYGGGSGRDMTIANGIGVNNARVELYDNAGVFQEFTLSDSTGEYSMGGMENGSYSVRVVNNTVNSSRIGGVSCTTCLPVQTYRENYVAGVGFSGVINEVGGANPSGEDVAAGILTNAQTVSTVSIASEGVIGLDFGFNFNTIVNTNEDGQGSLEQFIVNANNLDETGLNIEANSIFDPLVGEDTSIFMIPPTSDSMGRTADTGYASGYFNILVSDGNPLTTILGDNTIIDGRTQTAYSGNSNSGTVGSGGSLVGRSGITLPDFNRPEIQVHKNNGDVLNTQGTNVVIRNISVYAENNAGIRIQNGNTSVLESLLGVNAIGNNAGNIDYGIEITGGVAIVNGNYIATNVDAGVFINGGTSVTIQNNHITSNGNGVCDDNITISSGSGIVIEQNLIDSAASLGIDGDGSAGSISIIENTITTSGQNGGICMANVENAGILLDGSNSLVSNNIIFSNGGSGIVLSGGNTSGNLITQNSFYANGTAGAALGIDLDASNFVGDGVTLNELNDVDNGPNGLINFPLLSNIFLSGSQIIISGWSAPGTTIEFFVTDVSEGTASAGDNQLGQSVDYGEGQIYLGSFIEGSSADLDNGTSLYTDNDGNTDNTNEFKFQMTVPPSVGIGSLITATATLSNSTSEFSPFSTVKSYSVITNRRITYRVKKE